jgi:hypothetical protein
MSIFGIRDSGQKVVTNGLGLFFDFSQNYSYPGNGTTIQNIAGTNTATLNGGYTFYTGNGGYLADFQLFNSYTLINSYTANTLAGLTMQAVVMFTEGQYDGPKIIASTNSGGNDFGLEVGNPYNIGIVSDGGGRFARTTVTQNQWSFVSGVRDVSTLSLSIRVNNGSRITNTYGSLGNVNFTNGWMFARSGSSSTQFRGRVGAVLFYTRALTSDEELQNFNALRLRFGL